jgi:TonB family protein
MRRLRAQDLLAWVIAAFVVFAAVSAEAQKRPLTGQLSPRQLQERLERWQKAYKEILADLKDGGRHSAKLARKHAAALFEDVVDRALSGDVFRQTAGRVLTLLAVAEARLGDRDAGAWHWQMAQNVLPELRGLAFDDFPDVASFMKESLIPNRRWEALRRAAKGERAESADERMGIVPPRNTKKVRPIYPAGLAGHLIGGETIVEAVIDEQGMVREPVVQRSAGHLALDLAAMDALREWRYAPATLGGKPVRVFVTVKVTFHF